MSDHRLDDFDEAGLLKIEALDYDLDAFDDNGLKDEPPIVLTGLDVTLFLALAASEVWRDVFAEDLHIPSDEIDGRPLLSTTIPLVTFRHFFCGQGLLAASNKLLMSRLFDQTSSWKCKGCDVVGITGFLAKGAV